MIAQTDFGPALAALTALVVVALPLAVVVTKVIDFIRNLIDTEDKMPHWVWSILALVVGVLVAFGFGINLWAAVVAAIPAIADRSGSQNELGMLLSGLTLGAMAGFWHDKMAQWAAAHGNP